MKKLRNIIKLKNARRKILRPLTLIAMHATLVGATSSMVWADTIVGDADNYIISFDNDNGGYGKFYVNDVNAGQNWAAQPSKAPGTSGITTISSDAGSTVIQSVNPVDTGGAITTNLTTFNASGITTAGTLAVGGNITMGGATVATQSYVTSAVSSEASARSSADATLQSDINTRVQTDTAASLHGLNNNGYGITNAGAISGATNITASGTVSGATGTFTTLSGTTLGGNLAAAGYNITGVGNVGTNTLSTSGLATLNSASITNNATVGGTLGVTGATTLAGTLDARGAIANSTGNVTISDALDVTGTTSINTTGGASTYLGNYGAGSVDLKASNIYIQTGNGANQIYMDSANVNLISGTNSVGVRADTGTTVTGAMSVNSGGGSTELTIGTGTVAVIGATNINASANNTTNINTGSSTAAVTIGNISNSVSMLGGTNTIGNAGSSANIMTGASNTLTASGANSITGGTGNTMTATTGTNTINAEAANNVITAATTNAMTGGTGNTVTATTGANTINAAAANNVITAATTNAITGGTGNSVTATTGNNAITATAGSNTVTANAASQSNTLSATGANGTNYLTANATTGANNIEAKSNNIGVATANSINAIGNSSLATTVTATGGNSYMSVINGSASLRSGTGATASGLTATSAPQTLGTSIADLNTQLNGVGDNASRQNIAGASYVNRLEGDTLINGNTYINGTLVYTSNTSATTTVTSGASILNNSFQSTNGQMNIVNSGGSGAIVDHNGKITTGLVDQSTASLTLTNGIGNTHGLVVTEEKTVLSGGTRSTTMTLHDDGATFAEAVTGEAVRVHGVDDGMAPTDAVNVRQLAQGVAMAAGLAALPQVEQGKTFAIAAGTGFYKGTESLAIGASARFLERFVVKGGVSMVPEASHITTTGNIGIAYSW